VTIFEAQLQLGGLLRDGIPPYRLPRHVLDGEIGRILDLGIEVRAGAALATAERFARLRAEFDAVYFAMGARRQKRLAQLDYGRPWVMDGAAYLAQSNAGMPPALGRRLAVIGGGSAAMDVARSACRAGHAVSVVSLEPESQMPAQREEVIQAREEGAVLFDGAQLQSVAADRAGGMLLKCVRVRFQAGPVPGSFQVTPIAGSEFDLAADAIVAAIGQDPDLAAVQPLIEADGALIRADARGSTSLEGVFAGGDVASTARFVTHAIGMGKEAARHIDRWLRSETRPREEVASAVPPGAINTFYFPHAARAEGDRLAVETRRRSYQEVQRGLAPEQALTEAGRCFSCGNCIFCDNCFHYCPDMAVKRVPGGYAIDAGYCKGCGLCVEECPTGSIEMREERR
jgi:NADPH-dependent glutamate synthase beta subunit-like oxidoreductase